MDLEEAEKITRRLGEKYARIALLERKQTEIKAEIQRLETEIKSMTTYVASAAATLEGSPHAARAGGEQDPDGHHFDLDMAHPEEAAMTRLRERAEKAEQERDAARADAKQAWLAHDRESAHRQCADIVRQHQNE